MRDQEKAQKKLQTYYVKSNESKSTIRKRTDQIPGRGEEKKRKEKKVVKRGICNMKCSVLGVVECGRNL